MGIAAVVMAVVIAIANFDMPRRILRNSGHSRRENSRKSATSSQSQGPGAQHVQLRHRNALPNGGVRVYTLWVEA